MLRHEFQNYRKNLENWFRKSDIVLINRGFRNAVTLLNDLGIVVRMPALLARGQKKLTTEQANESRIVTKNW